MARTKDMFQRFNAEMKRIGGKTITWAEYVKGTPKRRPGRPRIDPALKKKSHRGFYNFDIEPDQPKSINRPPAVYNNTSVREKYGL